ncbi:hypothetical protein B9X75_00100 [Acinetobacter pittii]|uniref:hypothetical protein n=1 Tax=Acinetobacter pittii TaxID=48296 RepID=UPI000839AD9B|nr:hypothetical protein [Acinetobacter pittii]MCK0901024.1 hypothetical protein [Acinetobacter pittii]OCY99331.1 hypothetical protein BFR94_02270 [Acinetobacter pittii]OTL37399.1 hypothetical protein B9X75_00100 [Acinetobacter pittii]OTM18228.1 hypothetical protein B9X53_06660 [Acinetobacter pittii]
MRKLLFTCISLFAFNCNAEMVKGSDVNKPELEKACLQKAPSQERIENFFIDDNYVLQRRKSDGEETTFVAVNPERPLLVMCSVNSGTGKFGPTIFLNSSNKNIWKVDRPEPLKSLNTYEGRNLAIKTCRDYIATKFDAATIHKISLGGVDEVRTASGVRHPIGYKIGSNYAKRYDVIADGTVILNFTENGVDKKTKDYECLMDPYFKVKDISIK